MVALQGQKIYMHNTAIYTNEFTLSNVSDPDPGLPYSESVLFNKAYSDLQGAAILLTV